MNKVPTAKTTLDVTGEEPTGDATMSRRTWKDDLRCGTRLCNILIGVAVAIGVAAGLLTLILIVTGPTSKRIFTERRPTQEIPEDRRTRPEKIRAKLAEDCAEATAAWARAGYTYSLLPYYLEAEPFRALTIADLERFMNHDDNVGRVPKDDYTAMKTALGSLSPAVTLPDYPRAEDVTPAAKLAHATGIEAENAVWIAGRYTTHRSWIAGIEAENAAWIAGGYTVTATTAATPTIAQFRQFVNAAANAGRDAEADYNRIRDELAKPFTNITTLPAWGGVDFDYVAEHHEETGRWRAAGYDILPLEHQPGEPTEGAAPMPQDASTTTTVHGLDGTAYAVAHGPDATIGELWQLLGTAHGLAPTHYTLHGDDHGGVEGPDTGAPLGAAGRVADHDQLVILARSTPVAPAADSPPTLAQIRSFMNTNPGRDPRAEYEAMRAILKPFTGLVLPAWPFENWRTGFLGDAAAKFDHVVENHAETGRWTSSGRRLATSCGYNFYVDQAAPNLAQLRRYINPEPTRMQIRQNRYRIHPPLYIIDKNTLDPKTEYEAMRAELAKPFTGLALPPWNDADYTPAMRIAHVLEHGDYTWDHTYRPPFGVLYAVTENTTAASDPPSEAQIIQYLKERVDCAARFRQRRYSNDEMTETIFGRPVRTDYERMQAMLGERFTNITLPDYVPLALTREQIIGNFCTAQAAAWGIDNFTTGTLPTFTRSQFTPTAAVTSAEDSWNQVKAALANGDYRPEVEVLPEYSTLAEY